MGSGSDDLASNLASSVTLSKPVEPHVASVFPFCKMGMRWHLPHETAVRLNETVCGEGVEQSLTHRKVLVSVRDAGGTRGLRQMPHLLAPKRIPRQPGNTLGVQKERRPLGNPHSCSGTGEPAMEGEPGPVPRVVHALVSGTSVLCSYS